MTTISIQRTLEDKTFEEVAIERLRLWQPREGCGSSWKLKPYRLAFSGGKDSIVIKHLADRAGVIYEAHFSQTTIDPPEVVKFIREHYPDVKWDRPRRTMFKIIEEKGALPTRMMRFCCKELKEVGGKGDVVITGIRWEESPKRRARFPFEESTIKKGMFFVNPIIEWSTQDIWDYIRRYRLPYCSLYDEGYKRIGCIMCPLQGEEGMRWDANRYPAIYRRYLKAIRRTLDSKHHAYWEGRTAEEIMEWWITGKWSTKRTT